MSFNKPEQSKNKPVLSSNMPELSKNKSYLHYRFSPLKPPIAQDEYEIIIHFRPGALDNYIKRKNLNECIPDASSDEWIKIDPGHKRIEFN
jgi:hypothetical protein